MMDISKLKGADIFQGLRMNEINEIIKLCEEIKYEKDTAIFREGQPAEFLLVSLFN